MIGIALCIDRDTSTLYQNTFLLSPREPNIGLKKKSMLVVEQKYRARKNVPTPATASPIQIVNK